MIRRAFLFATFRQNSGRMLSVNFTPFPTLSTERLVLRQMNEADAEALFLLRSNPEIMRFIPRPIAQSVTDSVQLIQTLAEASSRNESITWGICQKNDQTVIGTIGYVRMAKEHHRAEVGYLLHTGYQGRGIMHEALTEVVRYGFEEMRLHSIEAIIHPQNSASAHVLERAGFIQEAHFKENQFYGGQFQDSIHYARLTPVC